MIADIKTIGRWDHVAVVIDGSHRSDRALLAASAAAYEHASRLSIIAVLSRPLPFTGLAGVCPIALESDLREEACRIAHSARDAVPAEVPLFTYWRCGGAEAVAAVLNSTDTDVVFLAPAARFAGVGAGVSRRTVRDLRQCTRTELVVCEDLSLKEVDRFERLGSDGDDCSRTIDGRRRW